MQDRNYKNNSGAPRKLSAGSIQKFKIIIKHDYGIDLTDEEANRFGFSLLRLSRFAITALYESDEKQNRESSQKNSL